MRFATVIIKKDRGRFGKAASVATSLRGTVECVRLFVHIQMQGKSWEVCISCDVCLSIVRQVAESASLGFKYVVAESPSFEWVISAVRGCNSVSARHVNHTANP